MFDRGIEIKNPQQVAVMRRAGLVVASTLDVVRRSVAVGITTAELNAIAHDHIRAKGATSNFLGYHGFPAVICTSVNDEVVHGIPGHRRLEHGDVISVDCGAIIDGWHGDSAITIAVGEVEPSVAELMRVTEEALWHGIAAARLGGRVGDISHAIETFVDSQGEYGIVAGYTGHGIGTAMHQPPNVPNYGRPGRGAKLVEGLVLAVEPMISLGSANSRTLADEWTVVSDDGSWAAHYEHTFTLTSNGVWVLTAEDGGRSRLAEMGVPYGGD